MDALRPRLRAISLNFEPFLYSSKISSLVFIKSGLRFIGVDFEFFVFFSLKIFLSQENKKMTVQTFGGSSGFLGGERMACSGSRAITEVGWICFLAKSSSFLISTYSAFKFYVIIWEITLAFSDSLAMLRFFEFHMSDNFQIIFILFGWILFTLLSDWNRSNSMIDPILIENPGTKNWSQKDILDKKSLIGPLFNNRTRISCLVLPQIAIFEVFRKFWVLTLLIMLVVKTILPFYSWKDE